MSNEFASATSIRKLQTSELHLHLRELVREERRIGVEVLEALREVESRRAHCELGHSSLFSYCVKELGYSESQAYRRVEAMRALKEVPELKEKIESGALTMTTVSMIQTAARKARVNQEEKKALFQKMEGKPASAVELELKPQDAPRMHWLEITDEAKVLLNRVKEVSAARFRDLNPSSSELIILLASKWLNSNDPLVLAEKAARAKETEPTSSRKNHRINDQSSRDSTSAQVAPERSSLQISQSASASSASLKNPSTTISVSVPHTRYIPAAVNRAIWLRDRGQCAFVSSAGRRCDSKYALQRDHILRSCKRSHSAGAAYFMALSSALSEAKLERVMK